MMTINEALGQARQRIEDDGPICASLPEEQTKTALVLPMLHDILGVSTDARHFRAEHCTGGLDKVDYAVLAGDRVSLLIECKPLGAVANVVPHLPQLRKYFGHDGCRVVCLTDGRLLHLFTDLAMAGIMDDEPAVTIDFANASSTDIEFLTRMRRCVLDGNGLRDAIVQYGRQGWLRSMLVANAEAVIGALGIDVSNPDALVVWEDALSGICSDASSDEPTAEETPVVHGSIHPLPSDLDLSRGEIYRIHWTTWHGASPYDGFIWLPSPENLRTTCYILPGSRIRRTECEAFRNNRGHKKIMLRRNLINAQSDDGVVLDIMAIEAASGAARIISGTDVKFAQTRKEKISVEQYYELVPEAYGGLNVHRDEA